MDAEYFAKVKETEKCPDGMSIWEWKRLKEKQEFERHTSRNESKVVRNKEDLESLINRGEVFTAAELAANEKAEEEAKRQFELAMLDQERYNQNKKLNGIVKKMIPYTREPFVE